MVITANNQYAAFCIGKAAYPFHMVITPGLFPLNMLVFFHAGRILTVTKPRLSRNIFFQPVVDQSLIKKEITISANAFYGIPGQ
jgi:hypothetical protein